MIMKCEAGVGVLAIALLCAVSEGSAVETEVARIPRGNDGDIGNCTRPENPCRNGGTCEMVGDSVQCFCTPGYTGPFCTDDFNECDDTCQSGGTCRKLGRSYMCECPPGYSGPLCECEDALCEENICQNGGICRTDGDTTECQCPAGFTGRLCEQSFTDCDTENYCLYGGTCMMFPNGMRSCICTPGCTGTNCETATDSYFVRAYKSCEENFCLGGGTCVEVLNRYECTCNQDCTYGESFYCPNEMYGRCPENPCQNGGSCAVPVGTDSFQCQCSDGFSGPICTDVVLDAGATARAVGATVITASVVSVIALIYN